MNRILDIDELAPRSGTNLRAAMVTETYPPEVNGVARTIGLMVEGLCARGHAVQLVRPRQPRADKGAEGADFHELLRPGIPVPRYTQTVNQPLYVRRRLQPCARYAARDVSR